MNHYQIQFSVALDYRKHLAMQLHIDWGLSQMLVKV